MRHLQYEKATTLVSSGQPRGAQGKIYVVTALIEYLTVLLEYIDLFGAHKQSG